MHRIWSDKFMESKTHISQENVRTITLFCLKILCVLTHLCAEVNIIIQKINISAPTPKMALHENLGAPYPWIVIFLHGPQKIIQGYLDPWITRNIHLCLCVFLDFQLHLLCQNQNFANYLRKLSQILSNADILSFF